jgi:predicted ATPase/DNA-binding SARP family transcriptional activator
MPDHPVVRVDLLGPLRLTVSGAAIDVPGPKRRAVLALLAAAEGRSVPVDDLLDALWPAEVPSSARASLHSHVSRVRRHLGAAAGRLQAQPLAYRLDLGPDGTDIARARSLLAASARVAGAERLRAAAEARDLWRGEPLAEFADVPRLAALAVALHDLRRTVEHEYAAALLDAGDAAGAAEAAGRLAAAEPLAEPAVVLLVRALHALGRSAEALQAAYAFRRRLVSEAGLDPSGELALVEREVAGAARSRPGAVRPSADRLRGRDSELAALHRLLAAERVVTVLGPGGVGKTRVATEVASRVDPSTALLLAPVTDPGAVPHALAAALDLRVTHGDVLAACALLLGAGPHLLLVDNCEHLLDAARQLVATLVAHCPELTVLTTSREPLGLPVEQRLRIGPLGVAEDDRPEEVAAAPAVALFVDRARRARPDFVPTPGDMLSIAAIVRGLDGLPLAIELAAGRLSSLDLGGLHARLDRSLDLLRDGRQVSLRQTIDWSYRLLPAGEQRLLRHLATFPDGVDLETAERLAAALDASADPAVAVAHLVDASMVEVAPGVPPRYRMLDTVRSFAQDERLAHGEDHDAGERFLSWALELAAWIDATVDTDDEVRVDAILRRELGNLRAAWIRLRAESRLDEAVRLVQGIYDAAGWRDLTEAWEWSLELADDPGIESHDLASSLLGIAAATAWGRADLDRAESLARRGLAPAGPGAWRCHAALCLVALSRGQLAAAVEYGERAAAQSDRPDQSLGVAALAAAYAGDFDAAARLCARFAAVVSSPTLRAFHAYVVAEIAAAQNRPDVAELRYSEALKLARSSGSSFVAGIAGVGLLSLHARTGRVTEALRGYADLLDYWERTGGWVQQWTTLRNLARLLEQLGDEATAEWLDAAADSAPDAPPAQHRAQPRPDTPVGVPDAASTSRATVLDVARRAITRHSAVVAPPNQGRTGGCPTE